MSKDNEKKLSLLYIEDINSMISFKDWIKNNLPSYKDKDPTESEMESFINFIENKKRDQIRSENAPEWREKIKVLRERNKKQT
tara:strand:+ start:13017 stop:13265 length:249 start_codon:yes stop_codon:yes gene_type:complete